MPSTDRPIGGHARVYIAGPMTGLPLFNKPAFHKAAQQLRFAGFAVVSPAELHTHTDRPWDWYMRQALGALLMCDAVLMLDGWEKSKGAQLEFRVATDLGMQILYQADIAR